MTEVLKSLAESAQGERVRIVAVTGHDAVGMRLMEMGLTPGVEMELLGTAPLGDPLEFAVRGYRLSLRRAEAARVSVEAV
jgi:ferrous iron transport protein A